ncbi:Integral membrane protein [Minicystis rosea]|nr:Integral membrane protein [Minicystis rosea]
MAGLPTTTTFFGALTFCAALGSGVVGGIFFAFSSFVMPALSRLPAAQGIAAMTSINTAVLNASFALAFFGTSAACAVLGVRALMGVRDRGALFLVIGSALYLLGSVAVTLARNVPHNEALATVDPSSAAAATAWARYVADWTAWNHVRTAASVAAMASFIQAWRVG